ncbi:hypothetical protein ALO43_200310 [Pseudomonas tremae]|uniref:Dioxygenase n=1 Tax=Pseudomonas tremae TaxID=200454 RepID=A0AA40P0X3_9PSED|nr:hypothetical protein ALO43_200310 [Pseudomonas tremae]
MPSWPDKIPPIQLGKPVIKGTIVCTYHCTLNAHAVMAAIFIISLATSSKATFIPRYSHCMFRSVKWINHIVPKSAPSPSITLAIPVTKALCRAASTKLNNVWAIFVTSMPPPLFCSGKGGVVEIDDAAFQTHGCEAAKHTQYRIRLGLGFELLYIRNWLFVA